MVQLIKLLSNFIKAGVVVVKDTWIWLPEKTYPNNQITKYDALSDNSNESYVVAEFKKEYSFEQSITRVSVRFSADTEVQLL